MTASLLAILEQVLKLGVLTVEERHRYDDNLKKLKEAFYEEYNKGPENWSDLALDDIDLKLRILNESIIEALRAKNS